MKLSDLKKFSANFKSHHLRNYPINTKITVLDEVIVTPTKHGHENVFVLCEVNGSLQWILLNNFWVVPVFKTAFNFMKQNYPHMLNRYDYPSNAERFQAITGKTFVITEIRRMKGHKFSNGLIVDGYRLIKQALLREVH